MDTEANPRGLSFETLFSNLHLPNKSCLGFFMFIPPPLSFFLCHLFPSCVLVQW